VKTTNFLNNGHTIEIILEILDYAGFPLYYDVMNKLQIEIIYKIKPYFIDIIYSSIILGCKVIIKINFQK
jgi:hypothetical protein